MCRAYPNGLFAVHKNRVDTIIADAGCIGNAVHECFELIAVVTRKALQITEPDKTLIILQECRNGALHEAFAIGEVCEVDRACLCTQQTGLEPDDQ